MPLKQSLLLGRIQVALVLVLVTKVATSQIITKPQCRDKCGSVSIPYPFGTSHGDGCYLDDYFLVVCNDSHYNPPQLFLPLTDTPVAILNISLPDGELQVRTPIARDCYNELGGNLTNEDESSHFNITSSSFSLSSRRNKFTAVGCDTVATLVGSRASGRNYSISVTACASICDKMDEVKNGSCNSVGCCQSPIPEGVVEYYTLSSSLLHNYTKVHHFNPCGYSFVADDTFNFSSLDLANFQNRTTVPVVLDWSVGSETCETAKQNFSAYGCRATHSDCVTVNSTNGGYRCKCSEGFDGNPYLVDGCQDVDECKISKPCSGNATCHNLIGTFECLCHKGYKGDGRLNGTTCNREDHTDQIALKLGIPLGICIGLLLLVVVGSWIYWGLKKRKLMKLKEKFFQQNGGLLLQQRLADQCKGSVESARVFSEEELRKATNNYDENMILGQGGYGIVYKGVLADNKVVAIKKSKIGDQSQMEQFINEVIVLSQINHRNVVKLIGCCLETEVPLLVYEFITNGTLSNHIHSKDHLHNSSLSWEMRLKIATETAGALSYLHSSASLPIIHRDIKTANILLDDKYTAKVADFGASRLVPIDQTQLTTLVQGTMGYLDPEYFHTSQLTEKSDVYSFGVVLAELLTGEKALCPHRRECDRNLAMYFVSSMKQDRLLQILDRSLNYVVGGDHHERSSTSIIQQLKEVANLVKRCVAVRGEDRPTMKEVATELEGLIKEMHPWAQDKNDLLPSEETDYSPKPSNDHHHYVSEDDHGASTTSGNTTTAVFDSIEVHLPTPYGDGR